MAMQVSVLSATELVSAINSSNPLRAYVNPGHNKKIAVHGGFISSHPAGTAGSVSYMVYEGGQGDSPTTIDRRNTRFSSSSEEKNVCTLDIPGYIVLAPCAPLEVACEITGSGVLADTSITCFYSLIACDAKADPTAAAVTDILATTATFNGTITPNGKGAITWIFQRATDATFDTGLTDTGGGTIGPGAPTSTGAITISEGETGLVTSTTYYVRLKVTDGSVTIYSDTVNFTTA